MKSLHLAGLIINAEMPEALAQFYRDTLGIPFTLQSHGPIRDHYECDFSGVHFAILRRRNPIGGAFVPSLAYANLEDALAGLSSYQVKPLHPIIELGAGKRITTIADPEGNALRLFQPKPA